ncbi:hypothetical protein B0O99DRAFT_675433 [Bisporella sp. PMI_857]|nr:hypothetical protein B0O99DRAFT_675433 [Bisporella sp. PMI_857]
MQFRVALLGLLFGLTSFASATPLPTEGLSTSALESALLPRVDPAVDKGKGRASSPATTYDDKYFKDKKNAADAAANYFLNAGGSKRKMEMNKRYAIREDHVSTTGAHARMVSGFLRPAAGGKWTFADVYMYEVVITPDQKAGLNHKAWSAARVNKDYKAKVVAGPLNRRWEVEDILKDNAQSILDKKPDYCKNVKIPKLPQGLTQPFTGADKTKQTNCFSFVDDFEKLLNA